MRSGPAANELQLLLGGTKDAGIEKYQTKGLLDFKRLSLPGRHCFCKLEEAATTSSCFATTRKEIFPAQEGFPHESAANTEIERDRETEREGGNGERACARRKRCRERESRQWRKRLHKTAREKLPAEEETSARANEPSLPDPCHRAWTSPIRSDPTRPDPTRCQATTDLLALQIGTPSLPKVFQK